MVAVVAVVVVLVVAVVVVAVIIVEVCMNEKSVYLAMAQFEKVLLTQESPLTGPDLNVFCRTGNTNYLSNPWYFMNCSL